MKCDFHVRRRLAYVVFLCGLVLAAAGCGSDQLDVYPTEALLLLDDKPFGPTAVMLVPQGEGGRSVQGQVDEQGKITFTSYEVGDGAPAGEYRVAVGTVMAAPPAPFPVVYRDMKKSPLTVTVEPKEKNELVIAMDSKAGKKAGAEIMTGGAMMRKAYESDEFRAGAE